jgi:hypothetical protein
MSSKGGKDGLPNSNMLFHLFEWTPQSLDLYYRDIYQFAGLSTTWSSRALSVCLTCSPSVGEYSDKAQLPTPEDHSC